MSDGKEKEVFLPETRGLLAGEDVRECLDPNGYGRRAKSMEIRLEIRVSKHEDGQLLFVGVLRFANLEPKW